MPVNVCYFVTCRRLMAVNSLLAKITLPKKPANWTHLSFQIASSPDCQNSQFWCTSSFGTHLGDSWAPKRVSKPMVLKMASSGDFQNSQFRCTSNFGTRLFFFFLRKVAIFFRGFEKGLAGGGWRPTTPKIQQNMFPRIVFSYS